MAVGRSGTAQPRKATAHRALDDIRESISELAYYRQHLFVVPPVPPAATPAHPPTE